MTYCHQCEDPRIQKFNDLINFIHYMSIIKADTHY